MAEVRVGPQNKDNPESAHRGSKRFITEISIDAKGLGKPSHDT